MGKLKNICLVALVFLLSSCEGLDPDKDKVAPENVMIFISEGFNNLSSYLLQDIQDMKKGYIPQKNDKNVLLILGHHLKRGYDVMTSPNLVRLYMDNEVMVCDTIMTLPEGSRLTTKQNLKAFLSFIQDEFPVENYGLVLSSHATGWLPAGYYSNPAIYEKKAGGTAGVMRAGYSSIFAHTYPETDPSLPITKTIMAEKIGSDMSEEMEIEDFADAIPMHLNYILFDACLMGCVEVAYALRNVADYIGFSQAEVMSEGFDYVNLASRLLSDQPDPRSVCEDYIALYESFTGSYRSATISLVRTENLPALASVCKGLFEKYREQIAALEPDNVQCFGGTKRYFYDLYDILSKAGAEQKDLAALDAAFNDCIAYKGTTGQYYSASDSSTHEIYSFCGLTTYLSPAGTAFLNTFYQSLDWNKDTNYITISK